LISLDATLPLEAVSRNVSKGKHPAELAICGKRKPAD
jgi:hypothetical protein